MIKKKMNNSSEIEKLILNCDLIKTYCITNETNERLIDDCEKLLESAKMINEIAIKKTLENLTINGYVLFLRVITSYTDELFKQISTKNRLDPKLIKIFDSIFVYSNTLFNIHRTLETNSNFSLLANKIPDDLMKSVYAVVHQEEDALKIIFSTYVAFYQERRMRKLSKLIVTIIACFRDLPFSLAALFSDDKMGKYYLKSIKHSNLNYPFKMYHLLESFAPVKLVYNLINFSVPVQSKTLDVPKQNRFKLNYRGDLLDFDCMTREEMDLYMNDTIEKEIQNSSGKRWRNAGTTIQCRYSRIKNREKIMESLDRIKNRKSDELFNKELKELKYQTAKRKPDLVDFNENENVKNKIVHFNQKDDSLNDEINPEKIIVLYVHGG